MRDLARINRIQGLIHNIWLQHPDLRYGQLLINLYAYYDYYKGFARTNYYNIEDSDWEEFLINFKGFE
jgi:hypothetical protein